MLKNLILCTLAVLTIVGCGSSGKNEKKPIINKVKEKAMIAGLKDLRKSANVDNLSDSGMSKTVDIAGKVKIDEVGGLCQTGSMNIIEVKNSSSLGFDAKNCSDGNTKVNGLVTVSFDTKESQEPTGGTLQIIKNLNVNDEENTFFIEKGGQISIKKDTNIQDVNKLDFAATFKSKINSMVLNVSGLSFNTVEPQCEFMQNSKDCDGTEYLNVQDGEFNIGKYYFKIDTSKKNTLISNDSRVKSGSIHLLDAVEHKVELIVENNDLLLKIDENGDGNFTKNEIMTLVEAEDKEQISCTEEYMPVCGVDHRVDCPENNQTCNQKTFSNQCYLNQSNFSYLKQGAC